MLSHYEEEEKYNQNCTNLYKTCTKSNLESKLVLHEGLRLLITFKIILLKTVQSLISNYDTKISVRHS